MDQQSADRLEIPELPSVESGITLVDTGEANQLIPIHTLTVDRVCLDAGEAVWVDSGRHAVTETLVDLAPSRRVLDRVRIARGFTPYQHTSLLQELADAIDDSTSLVVVPAVDYHYRDDVQGRDGQSLLAYGLAQLARVALEYDLPVLVTRHRDDEFSAPVEAAADSTITYRQTPIGARFVGEEFETLTYDCGDGYVQTTWAFWREVLSARKPLYPAAALAEQGVTVHGAN